MIPKVFAVVLNWNGTEDSRKCIESLLHSTYSNLHIVIVDNSSTDDSPYLLAKEFPDIELIQAERNGGYAYGMNLGAKYALELGADFVIYVNNDVIVTPTFLEPMLELARSRNEIGIVSSKVLYTEKPDIIYCAGAKVSYLRCGGVAEYQGRGKDECANEIRETTLAEGCLLLIKKSIFEKIGFMEEKYFMYLEDVDYAERVRAHFKIMYTNKSIIYHKSGAGKSWAEYSPLYYYYYTRNRLWYFADKNFFYRLYVIIFSLLNSMAKFFILAKTYLVQNENERIKSSIKSLWKGFLEGTFLILNLSKAKTQAL